MSATDQQELYSSLSRRTDANLVLLFVFGIIIGIYLLGAAAVFLGTMGTEAVDNRILRRASSWFTILPIMMSVTFIVLILTYEVRRLSIDEVSEDAALLHTCRALFVLSHATPSLYASPYVLNGLRVLLLYSTSLRLKLSVLVKDRTLAIIIVANFVLSFVGAVFFTDEPQGGLNSTVCFIYEPPKYFLPMVAFYCSVSTVLLYEMHRYRVSDYFQIKRELVSCVIVWSIFGTGYFIYLIFSESVDGLKQWQWENAPIHYIILINFCLTFHQSLVKAVKRKNILVHFNSSSSSSEASMRRWIASLLFQSKSSVLPDWELSSCHHHAELHYLTSIDNFDQIPQNVVKQFFKGTSPKFLDDSAVDANGFTYIDGTKHIDNYGSCIECTEVEYNSVTLNIGSANFCLPPEKKRPPDILCFLGVDRIGWNWSNDFEGALKCLLTTAKSVAHTWVHSNNFEKESKLEEICALLNAHESTEITGSLKLRLQSLSANAVSKAWPLQRALLNAPALHFMRIHASRSLCPELLDFFVAAREFKAEMLSLLVVLNVRYSKRLDNFAVDNAFHGLSRRQLDHTRKQFVSGCNMVSHVAKILVERSLNAADEMGFHTHGAYPRLSDHTMVKLAQLAKRIFKLFIEDESVLQVNVSERTRIVVAHNINALFGNLIDLSMSGNSRHRNPAVQVNTNRQATLVELSDENVIKLLRGSTQTSENCHEQMYGHLSGFLLEISAVFDEALEETLSVIESNLHMRFCGQDHVKLLEVLSQLGSPDIESKDGRKE
eukprot:gb/GECG01011558.1/.p1 GENE.gb/GECG01011558.1/~~gb/GECG01011558.1/.p1  ORF type:complete len:775 (+),score=71.05 gb/GECG01011558.1/:1-2325(+)